MEDQDKREDQVSILMIIAFFRQYINTLKLPLLNVYYDINIDEKVEIFDLGDLSVPGNTEKDMCTAHLALSNTIEPILVNTKGKVFIIGGSNDCSLASTRSLANTSEGWMVVHIDGGLDCNEEIKGVNSNSIYRQIHELAVEKKGEVCTFGCQTLKVHNDELDFAKSKGGKILFLKNDIRSQPVLEPIKLTDKVILNTAAGIMLNQILSKAEKSNKSILISWDISSLRVLFNTM